MEPLVPGKTVCSSFPHPSTVDEPSHSVPLLASSPALFEFSFVPGPGSVKQILTGL